MVLDGMMSFEFSEEGGPEEAFKNVDGDLGKAMKKFHEALENYGQADKTKKQEKLEEIIKVFEIGSFSIDALSELLSDTTMDPSTLDPNAKLYTVDNLNDFQLILEEQGGGEYDNLIKKVKDAIKNLADPCFQTSAQFDFTKKMLEKEFLSTEDFAQGFNNLTNEEIQNMGKDDQKILLDYISRYQSSIKVGPIFTTSVSEEQINSRLEEGFIEKVEAEAEAEAGYSILTFHKDKILSLLNSIESKETFEKVNQNFNNTYTTISGLCSDNGKYEYFLGDYIPDIVKNGLDNKGLDDDNLNDADITKVELSTSEGEDFTEFTITKFKKNSDEGLFRRTHKHHTTVTVRKYEDGSYEITTKYERNNTTTTYNSDDTLDTITLLHTTMRKFLGRAQQASKYQSTLQNQGAYHEQQEADEYLQAALSQFPTTTTATTA